ncbi:transcriptional regulator-domain-containing protein [Lasiosphaeria hispida]|uniref:Transcriptional regulator-domain-containing protein n=1 Tax=Lasiosphaeria hispida TaxID=260671 RepID=A0AAJ0HLL8_9PEZI|nr:transcriptional regulator-domain-containing protein [Lasiosphaeria hispida]
MASLARTIRTFPFPKGSLNQSSSVCAQCRRFFITFSPLQSGHNRWSKIKHDKAANDAKKTAIWTRFTKNIMLFSKLYGPDPDQNPQLASVIAAAKKTGLSKDKIENSISRGQGRTSDGAVLESMTFEAIVQPSIAIILDIETDNKLRALQKIREIVKKGKGVSTASKFFFSRLGRVVFEKGDSGLDVDAIMVDALEAGAEDLETDSDGNLVVWTQPTSTMQVCKDVGTKFGLTIQSSDIIWSPKKDMETKVDGGWEIVKFTSMLLELRGYPDVQAIYANIARGDMTDEEWDKIEENLDT